MKEAISPSNGELGLKVFRTCRNLIRTLRALPYSSVNPEDVDSDAEDDCYHAPRFTNEEDAQLPKSAGRWLLSDENGVRKDKNRTVFRK